ncbi:MAG: hypothetical protein PHH77_00665 [Victivallaceae bacterium]|nr:hypothetical protein [Victivallaceae bacterium]
MQRLGDPTAENVGRSSPMSESIARLAALEEYRSRKAIFSKKTKCVFENAERSSWIQTYKHYFIATSLSRRKSGIKPLLSVAIYTILAVDKKAAIK